MIDQESDYAARFAANASWHGIRTHNALKALHLDEYLGSDSEGCMPGAVIEKLPCRFEAAEMWNANRKLGQAVAFEAMETCMRLADRFGVRMVSVDNAFHDLWGGECIIDVAKPGYIGYTNCTSTLVEVVPFQGKEATLGTNLHTWGLPTTAAVGFANSVDWATSVVRAVVLWTISLQIKICGFCDSSWRIPPSERRQKEKGLSGRRNLCKISSPD